MHQDAARFRGRYVATRLTPSFVAVFLFTVLLGDNSRSQLSRRNLITIYRALEMGIEKKGYRWERWQTAGVSSSANRLGLAVRMEFPRRVAVGRLI